MSVLTNFTTLQLDNNTDYLIEITCETEQDENFHVKSSNNAILQNDDTSSSDFFAYLYNLLWGSKIKKVQINLPHKSEETLAISSKSTLLISYSPKILNSCEHITGILPIPIEHQGDELSIKFVATHGIGYDENGNVAIVGKKLPKKQDVIINITIKNSQKEGVFIDEYNPAICKLCRGL